MSRALIGRLSSCFVLCGALAALGAGSAAAAGCPNDVFRVGLSANLPACRAYEKVSPDEKGGFSVVNRDGGVFPSGSNRFGSEVLSDGLFKYTAGGAFANPEASDALGIPYLFRRGSAGWLTTPVTPAAVPPPTVIGLAQSFATSPDGSRSVVGTNAKLLPSAIETDELYGAGILYLRDNATHTYRLITRPPLEGEQPTGAATLVEATPDLHRVIFESGAVLVAGATQNIQNLYEWTDDGTELGQLALVGYRPAAEGGTPFEPGEAAQPNSASFDDRRTISADGRRVLFSAEEQLYARIDGTQTVKISASQRSTPDPAGPLKATYLTANAYDGSSVFFASGEKLTDDSNAEGALAQDLYRYDFATGSLTDITAGPSAAVLEGIIGATADVETFYFTALGELIPGQGTPGQTSIYRWHDDGSEKGELRFVATAPLRFYAPETPPSIDSVNGRPPLPPYPRTGVPAEQVSPSGRWLAFVSILPLTGYENQGTPQIFRYDSQTGQIICASCDPERDPAEPVATPTFGNPSRVDPPRVMADDGTVAFTTTQALVPADTNGRIDVYAFDGGSPKLISTGKSAEDSYLLGMSTDGTDVYLGTGQELLPSDRDDLFDIYDARVGGGFAEAAAATPCFGAACRGAANPLSPGTSPGTAGVTGSGNLDEACVASQNRARRLGARATELRRLAGKLEGPAARQLRARARRATKAAKRSKRNAKTCIRKNRRTAK